MTESIVIPAIADDGSLYPIEKMRAHAEAVFHLAVSVFVFDEDGALLIQRRAASKYHCGGMWANTCCSHPFWAETETDCARRRLKEELGFTLALEPQGVVEYSADVGGGLHEHEKVTVFIGRTTRDAIAIEPNPNEVSETRWVPLDVLRAEMAARPAAFTPWFRIYLTRFPDLDFSEAA